MELNDAMTRRKSVRNYTGEMISDEQLNHILKAAYAAPVGGARYNTVHMTIVKGRKMMDKIDENAAKMFHHDGLKPTYGAPIMIIFSIKDPGNEKVTSADPGFILQNMSLAAVQENVGACIIYGATVAIDMNEDFKRELGIPEGYTALGSLILGKTKETYLTREIPDHRFETNIVE